MEFTEKNIAEDQRFVDELVGLGSRATPTTVIGEEVIVGFNRRALKEKLGIQG